MKRLVVPDTRRSQKIACQYSYQIHGTLANSYHSNDQRASSTSTKQFCDFQEAEKKVAKDSARQQPANVKGRAAEEVRTAVGSSGCVALVGNFTSSRDCAMRADFLWRVEHA